MLADPQSPPSIRWEKCNPIPYDHKRRLTKSITIGDAVYIGCGASVMRYKPHLDQWESLPDFNLFQDYKMTEVNGQLVLVEDIPLTFAPLDMLRSPCRIVVWEETTQTYTTPYPSLPKVRQEFAAVGYQHYLIIMGGSAKVSMSFNSVQILDTREKKWYTANKLPWRVQLNKAICVGDTVVVMGGFSISRGFMKKIASAPLPALISQAKSANPENGSTSIWTELPDMPLHDMVPLTSQNKILLVHGSTKRFMEVYLYGDAQWSKHSSKVFMLDPSINKWVVLGKIPESYRSVYAILPLGELFTAGVKNNFSLKKQCLDQVYIGHLPFN